MILVDLEITDYKQFAGTHRFSPAPNGVVAVIGTNGAGKTTLFEAIEWCLFQPREIANAEVPPRGGSGPTRVTLTLHDPRSGDVYTVERRLTKSGAGQAEVARLADGRDGDREVVVSGTRPVTDYVWRSLVGLDHRAFVATFFTRQKELTFFGDTRPTERRREVQRLLGLETIRRAQETLAEERRLAHTQAESYRLQVAEIARERDFPAELAAAQAEADTATAAVAQKRVVAQQREQAHHRARIAVDEQTERRRQDTAFATDLARLAAEVAVQDRAIKAAQDEIDRLTALSATRLAVQETSATADAARGRVESLEVLRERFDRRTQASRDLADARRQLTAELDQARGLVASAPLPSLPDWTWPASAAADPIDAIDQLVLASGQLSVQEREQHLRSLEDAVAQTRVLEDTRADQLRFQAKLVALRSERDQLFSSGDPDDEIAHIDARERAVAVEQEQRRTTIHLMTETIDQLKTLVERLSRQVFEDDCPACGRPFTEHDAAAAQAHASKRLQDHEAHVATLRAAVEADTARLADLTRNRADAVTRRAAIKAIDERIVNGEGAVRVKDEALAAAMSAADATLAALGRSDAPSEAEVAAARVLLAAERTVQQASVGLRSRRPAIANHLATIAASETVLADLGDVAYDPAELTAARAALQAATAAAARLADIDAQLARLPDRLAERDTATVARQSAADEIAEVERRRASLAFQAADLTEATYTLDDAVEDERNAAGQLRAAEVAAETAAGRVRQVQHERDAHAALAAKADERTREHDVLDEMVKEFNAFDRFVTQRVRPQMEDLTSELVRIVTDDRYTEITLDDDYGVHVRDAKDGLDVELDRFPLGQFSGGERDVVSLCARLSLSRIIGAQAVNPPRFLVLDEVFGSLDRERRLNLLEMLSNLTGSADVFQQLFVISHLDDVRTSPAFTEVWRVAEHGDGTSHLENLNQTAGTEEL